MASPAPFPHPVLSAAAMRAWDHAAIQERGVPDRVLMESAGRTAAAVVERAFPSGRVVAAVGSGNNGGDALVVVRTLAAWGRDVAAVVVGAHPPSDALLHGWPVPLLPADEAEEAFRGASVVVDGLLGTGAKGAPRAAEAAAIAAMERAGRPVVALDGPSGIDLTTGAMPGAAVRADLTVTFGALKRGLLLFPGRAHAGRICVAEIGLTPRETSDADVDAVLVTRAWARARLPVIPPDAHKGDAGRVLVLAGRAGMAGAAVLAGRGALRAGAGYAVLASAAENRVVLQTSLPEALFVDRADADHLAGEAEKADAVVAGPGMGTGDGELRLLRRVVEASRAPLLFDADAATLLARHPGLRDEIDAPLLLTPHPGEMARLLGRETADVTADPFGAAQEAAERFRCAVLLKGAPSLVADPEAATLVSIAGHSGLATGGNGDVLSGVVGTFLALGCPPREAAGLGLHVSGRAAELAGRGRSLLPTDVTASLGRALAELDEPEPEPIVPGIVLDLPPPR